MDIFVMIMTCSLYPDNSITNAIVQTGSGGKALMVTSVAPDGTVTAKNNFRNIAQAAHYAQAAVNKGDDVAIGLMQIPYKWLPQYAGRASLEDLFRPCKNMVIATDALNNATRQCKEEYGDDEPGCALSVYRTGDEKKGEVYAATVLNYAKEYQLEENPQNPIPQPTELPVPDFGITSE